MIVGFGKPFNIVVRKAIFHPLRKKTAQCTICLKIPSRNALPPVQLEYRRGSFPFVGKSSRGRKITSDEVPGIWIEIKKIPRVFC